MVAAAACFLDALTDKIWYTVVCIRHGKVGGLSRKGAIRKKSKCGVP